VVPTRAPRPVSKPGRQADRAAR